MAEVKVRYKGLSDERIIPASDLQERGVTGIDKDLRWWIGNHWALTLPMSEELEAILRADGSFSFDPVKDDGTNDGDNADNTRTVDDTGNTVVMPDGQVDKKKD